MSDVIAVVRKWSWGGFSLMFIMDDVYGLNENARP